MNVLFVHWSRWSEIISVISTVHALWLLNNEHWRLWIRSKYNLLLRLTYTYQYTYTCFWIVPLCLCPRAFALCIYSERSFVCAQPPHLMRPSSPRAENAVGQFYKIRFIPDTEIALSRACSKSQISGYSRRALRAMAATIWLLFYNPVGWGKPWKADY